MKKILVTRRLIKENSDRMSNIFDVKLNNDDKLLSPDELLKFERLRWYFNFSTILVR